MSVFKFLVVVFVVAGVFSLWAQQGNMQYIQWYDQANRLYDLEDPTLSSDSTSLLLFLKVAEAAAVYKRDMASNALIKAGNIHQGYQRFAEANVLYYRAMDLNSGTNRNNALHYEVCLYLGSAHYFSNIIDSAQFYFEAASDVVSQYNGKETLPELDRLYNSLGAIYFESANYLQAKNYFERGLEFSSKSATDYNELYNGIQSNIASCLMKLNEYDAALEVLRVLKPEEKQQSIIQQNMAHCYFELSKYDSAMQLYKKLPGQTGFAGVVALTDIGRIYMKRKQWQEAEIIFDSAIALNKNISLLIKNKEEALAYLYRSELAKEQGLIDEALGWVNEALQEVHLDFKWEKTGDIPEEVSNTVSPITLFTILHAKASLLNEKYQRTGQQQMLSAALKSFKKAVETANFIKQNFDNDEAKYFFNKQYKSIYKEAIQLSFEAATKDEAYAEDYLFLIENYKGSILYQNLQNLVYKSSVAIPDSTRRREKELKQLLGFYTSRLNQSTEEKDAIQLQKRLLAIQVDLSRLQKIYVQDSGYLFNKIQTASGKNKLKVIQDKLDSKTALINYYVADGALYLMVVSAKEFTLKKVLTDTVFFQQFDLFKNEVYHYTEGKRYEGLDAAAILYRYLIHPIKSATDPFDNWVIVPDGFLYYIPFDALVSDASKRNYLVLDKTISYHYSFALLMEEQNHHNSEMNNRVLGFAPYTDADENINKTHLPVLALSEQELKEVSNQFYVSAAATKSTFTEMCSRFPVIHLATHASISGDSSNNWIQFYPSDSNDVNNKLFLPEIYNLDLHQAELVVLSACETGGGAASGGEGLLSLSRAFMFAGADGIISTLWKTEDQVTAFMMQRMHGYLKENMSPQKALQLAKKDVLRSSVLSSKYKTPNYWANFIYVGKLHPDKQNNQQWYWWSAAGLIMIIAFLYYRYRQKKKTSSLV